MNEYLYYSELYSSLSEVTISLKNILQINNYYFFQNILVYIQVIHDSIMYTHPFNVVQFFLDLTISFYRSQFTEIDALKGSLILIQRIVHLIR